MAKRNEIAKDILSVVGTTGLILAALTIPNLLLALKPFMKKPVYNGRQVKRSLDNLSKTNQVSIGQEGSATVIRLTKNGRKKLLKYKFDDMKLPMPRKWDHKWRMVIFDIPEKQKTNRTIFVYKLKELGFLPLQKSVWVWPYECEDEVDFLKEIYEIRPYVRVVRADYLDIENDLIQKFKL